MPTVLSRIDTDVDLAPVRTALEVLGWSAALGGVVFAFGGGALTPAIAVVVGSATAGHRIGQARGPLDSAFRNTVARLVALCLALVEFPALMRAQVALASSFTLVALSLVVGWGVVRWTLGWSSQEGSDAVQGA